MKNYTKKQFEKEVMKVIGKLNDEELETVRKGLYTLYNKLKNETDTIQIGNLNALSAFLHNITCMSASETMIRFRNKEVPY